MTRTLQRGKIMVACRYLVALLVCTLVIWWIAVLARTRPSAESTAPLRGQAATVPTPPNPQTLPATAVESAEADYIEVQGRSSLVRLGAALLNSPAPADRQKDWVFRADLNGLTVTGLRLGDRLWLRIGSDYEVELGDDLNVFNVTGGSGNVIEQGLRKANTLHRIALMLAEVPEALHGAARSHDADTARSAARVLNALSSTPLIFVVHGQDVAVRATLSLRKNATHADNG